MARDYSDNPPIRKLELQKYRSWVIHGRSGTGKTTFAGTFPKPLLYLDVKDRGGDSITGIPGIDVWDIEEWLDFEDAYYYLKKEGRKKYKTVVIDTTTQLEELCKQEVVSRGGKVKVDPKKLNDWGGMTRKQYGETSGKMKEWLTNYRDLPMEVVFIAQERVSREDDDDDEAMLPEVGPRVMPSVASHLNASVSIIVSTYIAKPKDKKGKPGRPKFSMRVGPNPIYVTKIRKAKEIEVPDDIVNPTYDDVLDIIKGD